MPGMRSRWPSGLFWRFKLGPVLFWCLSPRLFSHRSTILWWNFPITRRPQTKTLFSRREIFSRKQGTSGTGCGLHSAHLKRDRKTWHALDRRRDRQSHSWPSGPPCSSAGMRVSLRIRRGGCGCRCNVDSCRLSRSTRAALCSSARVPCKFAMSRSVAHVRGLRSGPQWL